MDAVGADAGLAKALASLVGKTDGLRASAVPRAARDGLVARLLETFAAASSLFGEAAAPRLRSDTRQHAVEHVDELTRLLSGGGADGLAFVRAHARRLVAQGIPIEAALVSYRSMQAVLADWVQGRIRPRQPARTAGLAASTAAKQSAAELVTAYVSACSIALASAYVAHTESSAEAEGDRRAELLSILCGGFEPSDARVARLLKRAGYLEQRLTFCVALAQSTDPLEMESPARVQRIADALVASVATLSIRVLVGVRSRLVTAVFCDLQRASGWTAAQASLADRVTGQLLTLGPAVLIGLSTEQAAPAQIPRGVHEASVALDFASVSERLVSFAQLSIRRLLIYSGSHDIQPALPAWFSDLVDADARARGQLVSTLRALADTDLNVQAAARQLQVHPNTVYARTQRLAAITGLDAHRFHDLTQLLLAVDCARR